MRRLVLSLAMVLGTTGCGSDGPTTPAPSPRGELLLSVRTVGDQVDPDGYTVVLDGAPEVEVPINGEIRIRGVTAGEQSLEVRDIASSCRLTNRQSPASIIVSAGATVRVDLEVFCLRPDPGRIFYTTLGGGVHVMNALGGDRRSLPLRADKVELTRDQERIVFSFDDDIWVAAADGSSPVNLTNTPNRGEGRPTWSPDGKRIAYERQEVLGNSANHLFVMNANGSGVTSLAPPEWTGGEPAWSPDGTRIAFRSHHASISPLGALWTIAPDGSQLTQLTVHGSFDTNPRWSPDGERLVFTRFMGSLSEGGTDFELFVIGADGSGFRQLTSDDRRTSEADWSPDGRWLVFASSDLVEPREGFDLFVMRADGTDRLRLTFGERAGLATWVP